MGYDQLTRDLAHKASDDAAGAIYRAMALHPDFDSKTMIALMATGSAMAIPAALLTVKLGADPETAAEALWHHLKPIVLDAMRNVQVSHG